MKHPALAVITLWVACGAALAAPGPEAVERVRPAVVTVVAGQVSGSGFVVRPQGIVVTAWHVVAGRPDAYVRLPGGRQCRVVGLLAFRPDRDYAVLKLANPGNPLPCVTLGNSAGVPTGAPVFTVGSPLGREQRLTEGTVISWRRGPRIADELVLDSGVRPGNSGGPLADARGAVIGIVTGAVPGTAHLGYATSIGELRLPGPDARVIPLGEAAMQFNGSAEELFLRGQELMRRVDAEGAPLGVAADRPAAERELLEAAYHQFAAAAKKRETFLSAWVNAGSCLAELRQYPEALGCLEKALSLCPDDLLARLRRAEIHSRLGRGEEAIRAAREIVSRLPGFAAGHLLLGRLLTEVGRARDGIPEIERAGALQPGNAAIVFELGRALLAGGNAAAAIDALARVAVQRRGFAAAYALLGEAYGRTGQHVRAVVSYRRALALHPAFAMAHFGLAVEYLAVGDEVRARQEADSVRRLDASLALKLPASLESGAP